MSNVVKEQPEDPVAFLITVLRTKQGKKVGKAALVTLSTAVLRLVQCGVFVCEGVGVSGCGCACVGASLHLCECRL